MEQRPLSRPGTAARRVPLALAAITASSIAAAALALAVSACTSDTSPPQQPVPPLPGESSPAPDATTTPSPTAESTAFPDIRLTPLRARFDSPLYVTNARDGSGDLYVVEKGGRIRIVRNGAVTGDAFLDISDMVSSGSEQGLLGLAFPEGYERKQRFYVDYTDRNGDTVISRFRVGENGRAERGSEQVMLRIAQPFANHNGGMIEFGRDGYLYVATGDGGSAGDPQGNASRRSSLLGKILRVRVETDEGGAPGRATPAPGNPFDNGDARYVWHFGLRNPWRFSFDRETGDMYIGDVGQSAWEEIDFAPAGESGIDFGWNRFEGRHTYPGGDRVEDFGDSYPPVAEYGHDEGYSVTGGYVYRGSRFPQMRGMYLYADFGSGTVWGLRRVDGRWRSRQLLEDAGSIAGFGEDETGEIYAADLDGRVLKVEAR